MNSNVSLFFIFRRIFSSSSWDGAILLGKERNKRHSIIFALLMTALLLKETSWKFAFKFFNIFPSMVNLLRSFSFDFVIFNYTYFQNSLAKKKSYKLANKYKYIYTWSKENRSHLLNTSIYLILLSDFSPGF